MCESNVPLKRSHKSEEEPVFLAQDRRHTQSLCKLDENLQNGWRASAAASIVSPLIESVHCLEKHH